MWGSSDSREARRFGWRHVLVSVLIFALAASVATRVFHGFCADNPSVQASVSHAMVQRLALDAVEFTRPVLQFADALLPVAALQAHLADPPIRSVEFLESLYNRPPPPVSFL